MLIQSENYKWIERTLLATLIILLAFYFSVICAKMYDGTDFPVFYRTAAIIMDPNIPNEMVYSIKNINLSTIPEDPGNNVFIYSMAVAYAFAPLALMPYIIAKTSLIFINIIAYLLAVIILLRYEGVSGRLLLYTLSLSFASLPLLENLILVQINAVLLLFVISAATFAKKERYALAGILLGIASLFKIYPIYISFLFGIKNWRIFLTCITVFALSFVIPGSEKWFSAMIRINPGSYSPIYTYFQNHGMVWFVIFAVTLVAVTTFFVYRTPHINYQLLASLSIVTVLLIIPVYEYHYCTLLVLPLLYLSVITRVNHFFNILLIACALDINIGFFNFANKEYLVFAAISILWLVTVIEVNKCGNNYKYVV